MANNNMNGSPLSTIYGYTPDSGLGGSFTRSLNLSDGRLINKRTNFGLYTGPEISYGVWNGSSYSDLTDSNLISLLDSNENYGDTLYYESNPLSSNLGFQLITLSLYSNYLTLYGGGNNTSSNASSSSPSNFTPNWKNISFDAFGNPTFKKPSFNSTTFDTSSISLSLHPRKNNNQLGLDSPLSTTSLDVSSPSENAMSAYLDERKDRLLLNMENIVNKPAIETRDPFDLKKLGMDYASDFAKEWTPKLRDMKMDTGIALQKSDNLDTRLVGQSYIQDAVNESTLEFTEGLKGLGLSSIAEETQLSFNDKFANSTFGKNFGMWSAGADMANSILTGVLGPKSEYAGPKGDLTRTLDSAYDTAADAIAAVPGFGLAASLIMKGGKALGAVTNKLGGGTDAMTTADAILGSAFLNLTPFGLINGFGGKRASTITRDDDIFDTIGASYTGSEYTVDSAVDKSGKKYGLFSKNARHEANREILEAKRLQSIMSDISNEANKRRAIRNHMSDINGKRRGFAMRGGYNQAAVRAGRHGLSIESVMIGKRVASAYKFANGGKTEDPFTVFVNSLPNYQRPTGDGGFNVKRYWELNGKPKDFKEAVKRGMYSKEEDGWHAHSVQYNPDADEYEFMKASDHPTLQYELDWYNSDDPEAVKFRDEWELDTSGGYYKYVKRKPLVESHKEGGIIYEVSLDSLPEFKQGGVIQSYIEEVYLEDFLPEFKEGGQVEGKKQRTLEELIEYAKKENPRFVLRMSEPVRDVDLGDGKRGTHRLTWGTTDNPNEAAVYPEIFENENGELVYDPEHAFENAKKGDVLFMTPEEAELFTVEYKKGWPQFFNSFKEGGKVNVIPEGALHARLHHMEDAENLTKKGIPVVSEKEGGELELQAEIEREEIIFRLEVTKKLEELMKQYNNDEHSLKEKDNVAIEAGKLLVYEILNNTIDNTNNLI